MLSSVTALRILFTLPTHLSVHSNLFYCITENFNIQGRGHVTHMNEIETAYKMLVRNPREDIIWEI
jgi:hypothetical protein